MTVEFNLSTRWTVRGTTEAVYDILSEPEAFVRWWPAVYLKVEELVPGDASGIGRVLRLCTKGKLPYTMHWQARTLERERPHRMVVEASGDLQGRGEWHFFQKGEWVHAHYKWTIVLTRPWMRRCAPLLKPVFAANHQWAMREGERGLRRELNRRKHAAADTQAPAKQLAG